MADQRLIAILGDLPGFIELKTYSVEERERRLETLARKTFANPEGHERLEWEKLRAFAAGMDFVLSAPERLKETPKGVVNERHGTE